MLNVFIRHYVKHGYLVSQLKQMVNEKTKNEEFIFLPQIETSKYTIKIPLVINRQKKFAGILKILRGIYEQMVQKILAF